MKVILLFTFAIVGALSQSLFRGSNILPPLKPSDDSSGLTKDEIGALLGTFKPIHLGPLKQTNKIDAIN
jgi:hypothetical protein